VEELLSGVGLAILGLVGQQELPHFVGDVVQPCLSHRVPASRNDVNVQNTILGVSGAGKCGFLKQLHCFFYVLLSSHIRQPHPCEGFSDSDQTFELPRGGSDGFGGDALRA